jgi:hypothetical protein
LLSACRKWLIAVVGVSPDIPQDIQLIDQIKVRDLQYLIPDPGTSHDPQKEKSNIVQYSGFSFVIEATTVVGQSRYSGWGVQS